MNDEDQERWRKVLLEYYLKKEFTEEKAHEVIDKVFAQAQAGWNRAPRALDTRIKMKSGFQWKSHDNLKPKQKQIKKFDPTDDKKSDFVDDSIFNHMTNKEKEWWDERVFSKEDFHKTN